VGTRWLTQRKKSGYLYKKAGVLMSIAEYRNRLQELDKRTLERRAERLRELASIQTDGKLFSSWREWDYAGEASDSYINGNYRSTIFCCACALEQVFKYEYLKAPQHEYKDIKSCTFGTVIKKCENKKIASLIPYLEKAQLLCDMRNTIAAHPLFVDIPINLSTNQDFKNTIVIKDIRSLLNLIGKLDKKFKKGIERAELVNSADNMIYHLGNIIRGQEEIPYNLRGFWSLMEKDILRFMALRSWHILKEITERLYGVTN
jgi:hypothetical protein